MASVVRLPSPNATLNELQAQFYEKNRLLAARFAAVAPEDYLERTLGDKELFVVVFGGSERERGTVVRVPREEIWKLAERDNAYLPYVDFHRDYYHGKTVKALRAIVADCDGTDALELRKLLRYVWNGLPLAPSYVVNSGQGIHFVYALGAPVEVRGLRRSLDELNRRIQEAFVGVGRLDRHPMVHPYRFPGFQTKIGTTATAFQTGRHYTLDELLEAFGVKGNDATRTYTPKPRKKPNVTYLPRARRALFTWVLRRLFRYPPIPGRRHNSFFALGIIAYKCRREVPPEEAREAAEMVWRDMVKIGVDRGFTLREAYRAFEKGYNPKGVTVTWRYLCGLLGWEYVPTKRNGRRRVDHCRYMNAIRSVRTEQRRKQLLPKMVELRSQGRSLRQIALAVGVSKDTVSRWLRE